jgi:hypothetical protein
MQPPTTTAKRNNRRWNDGKTQQPSLPEGEMREWRRQDQDEVRSGLRFE